jgi:hypothetical protein
MNQKSVFFSVILGITTAIDLLVPLLSWVTFLIYAVFFEKIGFLRSFCLISFGSALALLQVMPQIFMMFSLVNMTALAFFIALGATFCGTALIAFLFVWLLNKVLKLFFKRFYLRLTQISPRT